MFQFFLTPIVSFQSRNYSFDIIDKPKKTNRYVRENYLTGLFCFLCFIFFSYSSIGQPTKGELEKNKLSLLSNPAIKKAEFSSERKTPIFIELKEETTNYSAEQAKPLIEKFLNVRNGIDNLKNERTVKLNDNIDVLEFQQYFKGIKVDRSRYKAFVEKGSLKFYNGSYYAIPSNVDVTPKLNIEEALAIAKKHVGASHYVADDIAAQLKKPLDTKTKQILENELKDAQPGGEICFVQDFSKENETEIRLAYKFNIYASKPISRSYIYVDAKDGHILLVDAIIKHVEDAPPPPPVSVTTTVPTRYAGNRSIYVKQVSGNDPNNGQILQSSHPGTETYVPGSATYILMDDSRGNGIETYDLNGVGGLPISTPPAYTAAKSFTDVDNAWTLPEHKRSAGTDETENDDIAWDAHWGAEMVYDYWKNVHNRLSYDGQNAKIKSYIHSGVGYDNAFWNGTAMTYGDGSYPAPGGFKPLTSLDVCGHEIGHGVCSFTSDLVYARESGAMNEALSDIWAACVEYYAIKKIDPSLSAVYKPFYIGEQISPDPARPLRRMDSPQAEGNPDTYGGKFWTKQPGCTPTLANDQCGVHNNSGVLNKWFYLIAVGSGAGSGPDAAFAGADDGITDSVAGVHPAYTYSVKGMGFSLAEKVTYLMETMLTSTATFAEARTVSIAAASQIGGGPCSALTETITNAWYAVGVGDAFVKPCTTTYGFLTGGLSSTIGEEGIVKGCGKFKTVSVPIMMPPSSTATLTYSGTATNGIDYISSASLTNSATSSRRLYVLVKIFSDASVEPTETIVINASITNLGVNPVNTTYTLNLVDDDVVPVISNGIVTLLDETFTRADGFADPAGWTETLVIPETAGDPLATGKNQWGIFDNRLAITGKDGLTNVKFPNRNYNNASESRTIVKAPVVDGRGLTNLRLKFDYTVQGEIDPAGADPDNFPAFDYMAVVYSFNGVEYQELMTDGLKQFASAAETSGSIDVALPVSFNNRMFYLGFIWNNDANAGGPISASVDNLKVIGSGLGIENDRTQGSRQTINAFNDIYFKSDQDQQVVSRVKNNSNVNLGCTYSYIERTGDNTISIFRETGFKYRLAGKVVRVSPAVNTSINGNITIFYTNAQLAAVEAATGKNRSMFKVFKVDSTSFGLVRPNNTSILNATYTDISGVGGYYSADFTGRAASSFTVGELAIGASPKDYNAIVKGSVSTTTSYEFENIYPNPAHSDIRYNIYSPNSEKVRLEIVMLTGQVINVSNTKLVKGFNTINLPVQKLTNGSYIINFKNEKGEIINRQMFVKQ